MSTTVIGLFDNLTTAQDAIKDLVDGGFNRDHISLVSQEAEKKAEKKTLDDDTNEGDAAGTGAVSGTLLGGALGLLVGAGLLVIPGIGPVLAAGPLAAAIGTMTAAVGATALGAGLGAATGGLAGALVGEGVPEEEAKYYAEGVRRGGRLVSVQAEEEAVDRAHAIMQRHGAADIRERADTWRADGWNGEGDHNTTVPPVSGSVGGPIGSVGGVIGSVGSPIGTGFGGVMVPADHPVDDVNNVDGNRRERS